MSNQTVTAETMREEINQTKLDLETNVNDIKKLEHELKKIEIQEEYTHSDDNTLRMEAIVEQLAEKKMNQEELVLNVQAAEEKYNRLVGEIKHSELAEIAKDMEFQIPDEIPVLNQATLLASMAQSLQFSLISGEGYLARLNVQAYTRPYGEDNGGTAVDAGEVGLDAIDRYNELLADRDILRASMIALKDQYDELSHAHRGEFTWWPPFLRQTDAEVRQRSGEREAQRQQNWVEQQKALKTEANKMAALEFRTI